MASFLDGEHAQILQGIKKKPWNNKYNVVIDAFKILIYRSVLTINTNPMLKNDVMLWYSHQSLSFPYKCRLCVKCTRDVILSCYKCKRLFFFDTFLIIQQSFAVFCILVYTMNFSISLFYIYVFT